MKKIITIFCSLASLVLFASCDKFLDTMPDNRAEIDTEEKIQSLLTSAYADHSYIMLAEYFCDDLDRFNNDNVSSRFFDQLWAWEDINESNNESPENVWGAFYSAISSANHALQAIDQLVEENDGKWTTSLKQERAEALLCRAFGHFVLVNIFSKHYNTKTSTTDLGITYMEEPETTLKPEYTRGTVAEVYEKIERDLKEALLDVSDSYYSVPKYHFNPKAAYAFATRFYLYYEKWDEAIKWADACLGTAPKTMLRNYQAISQMAQSAGPITQEYINAELNCNLLLISVYSSCGTTLGNYTTNKRYAHGNYISLQETGKADNVWSTAANQWAPMKTYSGTNREYCIYWRLPYLFEYTDAVAGIGYTRTVYPAFTADECLLNRAEAYIHKKDYESALADMNLWAANVSKAPVTLTAELVNEFYNAQEYSYEDKFQMMSTLKKHLNPDFPIDEEGSIQETMFHCVLAMRRIETMPQGIRWFDVKRFGIEIPRRRMDGSGQPYELVDWMAKDDPRRAIQLPPKVISAGVEPNPRNK